MATRLKLLEQSIRKQSVRSKSLPNTPVNQQRAAHSPLKSSAKQRPDASKQLSATKQTSCVRHAQGFGEGITVPPGQLLQEQIDIIRGRRLGTPSAALQSLEHRILGSTPRARTQMLRLDRGQAPLQRPTWQQSNLQAAPQQAGVDTNALRLQQTYSPEFSAPDAGRFQVESFAAAMAPEDVFKVAPEVAPTFDPSYSRQPDAQFVAQPYQSEQPARRIAADGSPSATIPTSATPPLLEDDNWFAQARESIPGSPSTKKISAASKQSLASGVALAKDEFERDLAAILGTGSPVDSNPQPQDSASLFQPSTGPTNLAPSNLAPLNQAPTAAPAGVPANPNTPGAAPPHPSHAIFDQMGLGMRYANSFDLGQVNLADRFTQFDHALENHALENQELERQTTASRGSDQYSASSALSNPFVDPMALDEFDLVAELAEIEADYPELRKPELKKSRATAASDLALSNLALSNLALSNLAARPELPTPSTHLNPELTDNSRGTL